MNDIAQDSRSSVFVVKPANMLVEDGLEQQHPDGVGQVLSTIAKGELLQVREDEETSAHDTKHGCPEVALLLELLVGVVVLCCLH